MRKVLVVLIALVCVGGFSWYASRLTSESVGEEAIVARVGDTTFPAASVNIFLAVARQQQSDVTRQQVIDGLIENHLFAQFEQGHEQEDDAHHDGGSGIVAYSDEVQSQNELFRIVRQVFSREVEEVLREQQVGSPEDLFVTTLITDKHILSPLLTVKSGPYPVMDADQALAAETLVLVRYRLVDGRERDMTLADLYRQQNIQLKVQLHQMNTDFLREATMQYVATQFVLDWFSRSSGLNDDEVQAVTRMIRERQAKEELLHELGLMHDIHDDNPQLRALAEAVTTDEIRAYYEAHKDQFQRVEKVRARHIRLDSQTSADALYRKIRAGLSFDQALQQFIQSDASTAKQSGDLGWINRDDRNTHWLRSLAFVQPLQQPSAPFRSPEVSQPLHDVADPVTDKVMDMATDKVHWEIIFLDEKVMGYQPADSEGVRYEASKSIAQEKMQQQHAALRDRLWQSADVEYNAAWLNADNGGEKGE